MAQTTARKRATPRTKQVTEQEKQTKLEAYHTLKQAGVDIPKDLKTEVERWIRAEQKAEKEREVARKEYQQQRVAEANIHGPWYLRNRTGGPFNLRLEKERRIELKGRGQPGDLHPAKEEDLENPVVQRNVALQVIEVIPAGEAMLIMEKQTTNASPREHTPLAVLKGESGKPIDPENVRVAAEYNSQGVTVATFDNDPQSSRYNLPVRSAFVPTGNQPTKIESEGPAGPLKVTVAPVQKT